MRALIVDHRTEPKKNFFFNPSMIPNSPNAQFLYPNPVINPVLNAGTTGWTGLGGAVLSHVAGEAATGPLLSGLENERGYGRVTFPAGAGTMRAFANILAAYTAAQVYHIGSVYVRGPAGKTVIAAIDEYDANLNVVGASFGLETTLTGAWQQITVGRAWTQNKVVGSTALFSIYRGATTDTEFAVDFKYAMLTPTAYILPFYGRTIEGDGGEVLVEKTVLTDTLYYFYGTTGTALYAVGMIGANGVNATLVPGLAYKDPPTWTEYDLYSSVQLATEVGNNASYTEFTSETMTITPGKVYTFAATGHLPAPRIFAEHPYARSIVVITTSPDGTFTFFSPKVAALQGATSTVKIAVNIPANVTNVQVRLYNGGEYPNLMQWDSVAIWEGVGVWDYVDPDTRPYLYFGTVGKSPGVGIPTLGKQASQF